MHLIFVLLFSIVISSQVFAQQPDPIFLQKAITAVQTQRNLAMDASAVAEARLATTAEELAKAKTRIKELEDEKEKEKK